MRRQKPLQSAQEMNTRLCKPGPGLAVGIALVVASLTGAASFAQETIDPRTGQLQVEVTDLVLAAGPLTLDVTRTFRSTDMLGSALGPGWHLNWESSIHGSGDGAAILENGSATIFQPDDGSGELKSLGGDRLELLGDGRADRLGVDGVITSYEFDRGAGRLIARTDQNRNHVRLHYGESGGLSRIDGPRDNFFAITIDDSGRVSRIDSSMSSHVEYGFEGGLLTEARVNGGPPERYVYDEAGSLVTIERPSTGRVELSYDSRGRVTRRRWADGSEETYEYLGGGRETKLTDATGGITTFRWSEDWLHENITDPLGRTTVIEYDPNFNPVVVTDPAGTITRYRYDSRGRIVQIHSSDERIFGFEYRGDSQLVTEIHRPGGSEESFDYDQRGNLVAEKVNGTVLRRYSYSPDGLIETVEGIDLPKVSFTYFPNGLLQTETDALGLVTRYRYDDRGNLVSRTDTAGNIARWRYDGQNRVVSATNAADETTEYSYDERNLPVVVMDPKGAKTRFSYDVRGRLVSETDPLERTTRYEHRPDGQLSRTVDPGGHALRYEYDAAGRMVREVNSLGGITDYSYDSLDQVTAVSEPGGSTWTYRYAADGGIIRLTTPSGFSTQFDPAESRQDFVDPAGRLTSDLFNSLGQLTESHLPSGILESYRYDESGNLVEISTDTGLSASIGYDPLARPLRVVLPTGLEIRRNYDRRGDVARIEDSLGVVANLRYDEMGRLTDIVEADGATTRYRYDEVGRQVEQIDPLGHSTRYAYDPAGQLTGVTGPGGDVIGFEYDTSGWLAAIHHPGGGTTSFARDAIGNAIGVADSLGQTVERSYDAAGRLLREVDPKGQTTTLLYDEIGRLHRKIRPDGVAITYTYGASGNLVEVDDGAFPVQYSYDDRGNQTRISYPALERSLLFSYDDKDRLNRFVDSEGHAVSYRYDPFDRLTGIVTPNGASVSIAYDAKDRPDSVSYPNGITETWRYDSTDRVEEIAYRNRSGTIVASRRYTYDAAGNPVEVFDASGRVTRYRYDRSGQLVEEKGPWGFRRYRYRADGSRASLTDGEGAVMYEYDSGGRLVRAGEESFGYDARGNIVERSGPDGTTAYVFDAEDRLESAVLPNGESIRFGYAPTGERIWRENAAGRTWFITDGDHRLADLNEEKRLTSSYLFGPWLDRPLMVSSGEEIRWFLRDPLGTIIGVSDSAGNLIAEYETDAFGNRLSADSDLRHPFGFNAREVEPKLGLYYFRARYYDPRLGRFISADPLQPRLTDPLSANRYVFVRNSPIRFTDPMGLRAEQLWNADLPLPPEDKSVTALVRQMSQRFGTSPGRTAKLVIEEYRHLQRLSDLQHRVPNPRRLPRIMRERPRLHDAVQRVREQLELNKLFHRPGVDPRSPSSSLEGARKFLKLQRQRETAQAVTSLRNLGSTPPGWAVKPRNTKTVGARAPGAEGTATGAQPASSTNPGASSNGSALPPATSTGTGSSSVVQGAGATAAAASGSAGAPRNVPWSRTYKGPPPLSRTRGNWGPIRPKPPTAWEKFTKPPTAGQSLTLTLLLTNERILRCRGQGLTAGQCAQQFLSEVWDAKYEIGLFVTVAIVSPVAGTVLVGVATVYKGVTDAIEVGYSWWDKREAEQNLERILEERKRWTADNIKNNYTVAILQLSALIRDTGDILRKACDKLANTVEVMESGANSVEAELKKKPSIGDINVGANACRSLQGKEARLRSIHEEIRRLVEQIKGDVESAWRLAEACRSKQDAVKIRALIQANDATLREIEKAAAETEKIKRELVWNRDSIDEARKALRQAMDLRDALIDAASLMPPISTTEAEILRAETAIDLLTDPPPSLGNDINNLIKAFGDHDDLSPEIIADFNELRQQLQDLQPLATQCKPVDFLPRHRDAADKIVRAKLNAQALVDKLDATPLADCSIDSLMKLSVAILESAESAAGSRQFNEEAKKEARKCLGKHGLSITASGGGTGSGTSSSSSGSGGEPPPLVGASSAGSGGGGSGGGKPPLVDASKPGGPTTGGDPTKPAGVGASTAVKAQPGDDELVYANLDIELAKDDYGIYDILDNIQDAEIIVKTPHGEKQYLRTDAMRYLAGKGWIIHKSGVGWIATDRLKRFLGIAEPDEPVKPDKPKGSGRPTLGGMTFDGPLESYDPDDPNTPEGKKKILRDRLSELSRQCQATAESVEYWSCRENCMNLLFAEYGKISQDRVNTCQEECGAIFEQKKPQVCREAETVVAQLEKME